MWCHGAKMPQSAPVLFADFQAIEAAGVAADRIASPAPPGAR
jgi:hypothetical protein